MIRPLPKVKQSLSDPAHLPHVVQLLLTFDPVLVEKVAVLLLNVLEDNPRLPTLYLNGCFFFILMYTGSNLLPIGKFLGLSHNKVKITFPLSLSLSYSLSLSIHLRVLMGIKILLVPL